MKNAYFLMAVLLTFTVSAAAQTQNGTSSGSLVKSDSSANGSGSVDSSLGSMLNAGANIEGQLQSALDVKKSNVGDQVVLKTTKALKHNGEVVIQKGSTLIGRITEVKQKTKDSATSKIGVIFDRLQGKQLDVPVTASIVSIVSANTSATAGDLFASDLSGSSSTSGRATTTSSSGGGLLGGVGSTVGGVLNTTTSTVGNVAGSAVNTVGNTTGTVGRTVSGLQISQSASGSANSSSTISAQGKNVKIEKGATFNVRLNSSVSN